MMFQKKNSKVEKIYQNIVKISRSKFFYLELDLEDNFETRFDLIVFHAFMIFYFYKKKKILKTIDGMKTIESVNEEILKIIS